MNTGINKSQSLPPINQTLLRNTLVGSEAEKYRTLLHSIAIKLGLGNDESCELVEHALCFGQKNYSHQNNITLKVWISKNLVHNCIFKINSILFSQRNGESDPSCTSKMPISLRIVHVLYNCGSFTEQEVAYMLNITPRLVRERLAKAESYC